MIKTHCPICGQGTPYLVLYQANFNEDLVNEDIFSARRLPDKTHYRIVKCQKCGLVYSNPILEERKIIELYKKSKLTYQEEIDDLKETYSHYLKQVINLLPAKENLLEIGCGNGFFLRKALDFGFKNVFGVEPSIEAVKQASQSIKDNIIVDVFKSGLFEDNFFDIICAFQVFDHIINPNEFLANCRSYLKKDGLVLMINHNINAWTAKLLGEKCPMIDIEHPFLYDKKTFKQIFIKNNFKVEKIFDVKNNYPLYYWLKLMPLPKRLKQTLIRVFSWQFMKKLKFKIKAGNMGLMAKK